ncbi:MAG: alpha/beta hydrolase [Proteobacteria bacterium]|nr:alpha/beta hydrolase [Pseudomonadota bacterium]
MVRANGVALALHEAGAENRASGAAPVVLLHGFPEIAYSWRRQAPALAAAGRWVLAPDQRGYGGSDAPEPVEAYAIEALTADMIGLLDSVGAERAVWVGHDWGGLVAWELARRFPERTAGVVGLNTPYLPRPPEDPVAMLRERFGATHYIVWFQHRALPELIFQADLRRSFRFFLRRTDAHTGAGDTRRSTAVLANALDFLHPRREHQLLSPEELEVYVEAYRRSGFRGPVNWYRNLSGNWARSRDLPDHVGRPALMITAELDPFLPPQLSEGMEQFVPDLERASLPDCGHWTQQENPEEVNSILLDWLDRRFPLGAGAETA